MYCSFVVVPVKMWAGRVKIWSVCLIRRAEKPCCHDSFMFLFGSCWSFTAPLLSTSVFHVVEWHDYYSSNDNSWSFGWTVPFMYFPQINWTSCSALWANVSCDHELSMALRSQNMMPFAGTKDHIQMARFLASSLMRLEDIFLLSCGDCTHSRLDVTLISGG